MKKFLIIFCILLQFCTLSTYADEPPTPNDLPPVILEKKEDDGSKPKPKRPLSEVNQYITCTYADGELTLNFTEPEGICRGFVCF